MYRIDVPSAAVAPPTPAALGTEGYWTAGTPGVTPATVMDQDWFQALQENLIGVLTAAGVAHSKSDYTRLTTAIKALAAAGPSYVLVQEQQASGTNGGTFTNGAWRTRALNTKVTDTASIATLASNQVTLPAGTYRVQGWAIGCNVDGHQVRLQNITDGTTVCSGSSEQTAVPSADSQATASKLTAQFTIAGSKVFQLQHQCQTTQATVGFGPAAGAVFTVGNELYSQLEFIKVA